MKQPLQPSLVLEIDKNWDLDRPRPIEPYRYGKVSVLNKDIFHKYPELQQALEKHRWEAAYIHPKLLKKRGRLMEIAQNLANQNDNVTASIIASLSLEKPVLRSINQRIQRDLAAIQLGPNREFVNKIIDKIKNPKTINYLQELARQKEVVICDPFGGGGVLCYFIADQLVDIIGDKFKIVLIDLHRTGYEFTQPLIKALGKRRFNTLHKHVIFQQGDGLKLEGMKNGGCDLIVSTLSLHEHPSSTLISFFKEAETHLSHSGRILIADTTRESKILKRAEKRLPILSRIGMNIVSVKYLTKKYPDKVFSQLFHSALGESRWLAESGIRSYQSGLTIDELFNIVENAGLTTKNVSISYDYSPPIGGLVLEYIKI